MTEMISLKRVSKSYGSTVALHETSLTVREGEFVTLLGPSGSGKTTLLNLIAGTVSATQGEVWLNGRNVTAIPSNQRGLGMVFQNYALFPHMTVRRNIAFPLELRHRPAAEIKREVDRVLDLIRLPHVAERMPKELSDGQQQRIAIARSLVYNPSLILMDEPLGALDRKLRESLQLEIKKLHETLSMTVIYVTHDQEEALTMSDRICLMNHGRIEQICSPYEMYFKPETEFTADFLGVSNVFEATVIDDASVRLTDGTEINCQHGQDKAGERIHLMIRPESLQVHSTSLEAENILKGTLEDVVFLGSVTDIIVRLPDGSKFKAKQLTRVGRDDLAAGDPVWLSFTRQDVVPIRRHLTA